VSGTAEANRPASTPFGITVAIRSQPAFNSAATAAETHRWAYGRTIARS
jgi:hypothetical protein